MRSLKKQWIFKGFQKENKKKTRVRFTFLFICQARDPTTFVLRIGKSQKLKVEGCPSNTNIEISWHLLSLKNHPKHESYHHKFCIGMHMTMFCSVTTPLAFAALSRVPPGLQGGVNRPEQYVSTLWTDCVDQSQIRCILIFFFQKLR